MNSKLQHTSRYGAYGVLLQDSKILLTLKKTGPYAGRWGLPGGAIEFGETPEQALQRELLEETALAASNFELLSTSTSLCEYIKNGENLLLHHIGIIYKVSTLTLIPDIIPEEEGCWFSQKDIKLQELTPFARNVFEKGVI